MNRMIGIAVACLMLAAFTAIPATVFGADQEPDVTVDVSLDRDTIGLDEQALMTIIVKGPSQNMPAPQLPSMVRFEVYSQGRSSNISIVNGQVSSSSTYRYLLIPTKAGTYPIERIAVVYNGKRYVGNPVELTVLNRGSATPPDLEQQAQSGNGKSRDYFMEAVVDKATPYVNEQVTLSLKFYIAVQHYGNPELIEPTTTGFWTEILGNKAPYRQRIGDRVYKVIERKYALFPTQTGELTIGQAAIRVKVPAQGRQQRDPFGMFDDFFSSGKEQTVRSSPVTVNVQPLPDRGRPDDFTGSIGQYEITARPDKHRVQLNEPVTVTIRISGRGNIKAAAEPPIPELDDFRRYRASSNESVQKTNDRLGGVKTYEEVFVPRRPGQLEIPAIEYSYFNPGSGRYERSSTDPITVTAIKPEGYTGPADLPYSGSEMIIGSSARDIRYIKEDVDEVESAGGLVLFSPLYLIVNGVPVALLLGMIVVRHRREKLASNIGYARSIQAGKQARKRLAKARSLASVESGEAFYAELHQTLTSYIADKLNISPYGLTTESIRRLLAEREADDKLVSDAIDVLQRCDFARFAPASITQEDVDRALADVEDIMIRLEGVHFD